MSALTTVFAQGLAASRPAAASTNNGWFYLATDTVGGTLYQSNGSSWVQCGAGVSSGGGALTQIATNTLGSGAANITFSSIPGSYTDLILTFSGRSDQASSQGLTAQVNADTGANYDWQNFQGNGTTASAAQSIAGTSWTIGAVPGTGVTAGAATSLRMELPAYAKTTFNKTYLCDVFYPAGLSSGGLFAISYRGGWRNTAAITSIKIFPAAGNLLTGSTATLWGRT